MRQARWSIPLLVGAVLLAGCSSAGGSVPTPTIGSTAPPSPAPFVPVNGTAPQAPSEIDVWVPAGDHRVPGTLALPALSPGERAPAVLLLHGDFSNRDENADIFGRLAASLSARGIASLRIDFAGSGDSEEPDLALDYPGMVADATASLTYLGADGVLDPERLAVLGLSRGGSIAATLAGTVPGVAAMVSWSGAIYNGYDEDPDNHQVARENGDAPIDLGNREFDLSLAWFDTIEDSHPLDDVAGYTGPVLAVVGSDDQVVPPEVSDIFLDTVASTDKTLHTIDGADHGFGAEPAYGDEAIGVTTDWLVARLTAP
jgi:dienelactone hydrolase